MRVFYFQACILRVLCWCVHCLWSLLCWCSTIITVLQIHTTCQSGWVCYFNLWMTLPRSMHDQTITLSFTKIVSLGCFTSSGTKRRVRVVSLASAHETTWSRALPETAPEKRENARLGDARAIVQKSPRQRPWPWRRLPGHEQQHAAPRHSHELSLSPSSSLQSREDGEQFLPDHVFCPSQCSNIIIIIGPARGSQRGQILDRQNATWRGLRGAMQWLEVRRNGHRQVVFVDVHHLHHCVHFCHSILGS